VSGSSRNSACVPPVAQQKDTDVVPLPQRSTPKSPNIAEGLYELDGNPRRRASGARGIEVKGLEASEVVNPFMKPETTKDRILQEVRDAKERVRQEEVAPLEERLKALEAMVLQMTQQGNMRR
jgi:hypothetical protein